MKLKYKISIIVSFVLIMTGIVGLLYERQTAEPKSLDELKDRVEDYLSSFDEEMEISGIFAYKDSDYYFSIIEHETGIGAMELLVDPYTGRVHPEPGPNMMWNLKYGMYGVNNYGMMRNRRMFYTGEDGYDLEFQKNQISFEDAGDIAQEYIRKEMSKEYTVSEDGHEFYGYYTFHIEEDDATVGMISVNGASGQVWYHDWHGEIEQTYDLH